MSPHDDTHRRWILVIGSYALIVAISFTGFRAMEHDRDNACHERAADRKVLTQVVDVATGAANGPVDLSKIGGFSDLDPSTQQYLRNLSARLSAANAPDELPLHDRLVALLPPIVC